MIGLCAGMNVTHQSATKAMMAWHGVDCGPMRRPVKLDHAGETGGIARQTRGDRIF